MDGRSFGKDWWREREEEGVRVERRERKIFPKN
jgi:hypothetical protein